MLPKLDPSNLPNGYRAVVLYHYPCADGLASLVAAKRRIAKIYPHIHAIPVNYGSPTRPRPIPAAEIDSVRPHHVYIVDFSYSPAEIEKFCANHPCITRITIIDHHKTAIQQWVGTKCDTFSNTAGLANYLHFNMSGVGVTFIYPTEDQEKKLAGCGLTWKVLGGHTGNGDDHTPRALQLVNDRDLWNLSPDALRLHAYISTYEFHEDAFENLDSHLQDDSYVHIMLDKGQALLDARNKIIEETIGASLKFGRMVGEIVHPTTGKTCDVVWRFGLIDCTGVLASDAAEYTFKRCAEKGEHIDFVVSWYTTHEGTVTVGLRSRDHSLADVSAIASALGGGGHRNAAGCNGLSVAKFLDRFFKIERSLDDLPERHRADQIIVPDWSKFLEWTKVNDIGADLPHSIDSQQRYLGAMLVPNVIK